MFLDSELSSIKHLKVSPDNGPMQVGIVMGSANTRDEPFV